MRLSEYMAKEETSLVTFHLCILQHHPWGQVGSQRAVPGDQFQILSQCFCQGYDLNINPSMFAGYWSYGGGGGCTQREATLTYKQTLQRKDKQARWDTNPGSACQRGHSKTRESHVKKKKRKCSYSSWPWIAGEKKHIAGNIPVKSKHTHKRFIQTLAL